MAGTIVAAIAIALARAIRRGLQLRRSQAALPNQAGGAGKAQRNVRGSQSQPDSLTLPSWMLSKPKVHGEQMTEEQAFQAMVRHCAR